MTTDAPSAGSSSARRTEAWLHSWWEPRPMPSHESIFEVSALIVSLTVCSVVFICVFFFFGGGLAESVLAELGGADGQWHVLGPSFGLRRFGLAFFGGCVARLELGEDAVSAGVAHVDRHFSEDGLNAVRRVGAEVELAGECGDLCFVFHARRIALCATHARTIFAQCAISFLRGGVEALRERPEIDQVRWLVAS